MNRLCLVTAIVALTVTATTVTAAETPNPAVWSPHTVIVDLQDLPHRYSCDDLWYKFKGVLLALGARPDMKILPYRCERAVGAEAYSPKVQLEFSTPAAVGAKSARWADMQAVSRSVHLEPGSPSRLDAKDCELLNQIRSSLLPLLGDRVTGFNLACQAPPTASPPFELTVSALIPVSKSQPAVARTTADNSRSGS
jgi:hypothetical protein